MVRNWLSELRKHLIYSWATLLATAGVGLAQQPLPSAPAPVPAAATATELQAELAAQQKRIEELEALVRSGALRPAAVEEAADKKDGAAKDGAPKDGTAKKDDAKKDAPKPLDDAAVKKIVEGYLKENPGAGVPSGVQNGYSPSKGFYVDSTPDPKWTNWSDDSKIPFELRIRGRIQLDYYFYQPTDSRNHLTGALNTQARAPGINPAIRVNTAPTFSQLEVKRTRLIFEGTAFDPTFRYHLEFDGTTRGLAALAGGGEPAGNGTNSSGGVPGVVDGNGVATVDHAVRLFSAYVAKDFHPCGFEKGCAPDCCDGTYRYAPTFTLIAGKIKPFISFEEYLGSANCQFVEFGMSNWFFDADDDNLLMAAGAQAKAFDDRLFLQALVTNGNETQTANLQMDDLPGINLGGWYDFGGTWNTDKKKWDLFGDTLSDVDYSCHPVVRVGAAANLVPMDRRSEYDPVELNRIRAASAAPGGSTLIGILNGGGVNNILTSGVSTGVGQFAVDAIDSYTFDAYMAGKYRGFSIYNEWWARDLDNFRGRRAPTGAYPGNGNDQSILYTSNTVGGSSTALFPKNHGLFDYGMQLQAGYFIVPKKLEIAARWSYIRGESGDINGNGKFVNLTAAQLAAAGIPAGTVVHVFQNAFRDFHESDEYAIGINYFFHRQLAKWSTDISLYQGGNPAAGGQSPAGFLPGVDGWQLRTQFQFAF